MLCTQIYRVSQKLLTPLLKSLPDKEKKYLFLGIYVFFVRISNIAFCARARAQNMRNEHQLSYFKGNPHFLLQIPILRKNFMSI